MDKISGILSTSPRLMSADMRESSPIRPGTPSFGRPEGVSSLKEAATQAAAPVASSVASSATSSAAKAEPIDWRSKDQAHAALVAKLTNDFVVRPQKTPANIAPSGRETAMSQTENSPSFARSATNTTSTPAGFKTDEFGSLRAAPSRSLAASAMMDNFDRDETVTAAKLDQPDGLFPKGSFIDRTA